jgi:hypothetical protein
MGKVMQEFLSHGAASCCNCVLTYLSISFEIWYNHFPEAMSFGPGESILEFLNTSKDFSNGNSITIVSSFLKGTGVAPVIPMNAQICDLTSEAVVWSHTDFSLFRSAFESADQRLSPQRKLDLEDNDARFTPYLLDYFSTPEQRRNTTRYTAFRVPRDSLFDPALFVTPDLPAETHQARALLDGISDLQKRFQELDDYIWMQLNFRILRSFQGSILRFRNAIFAAFIRSHLGNQHVGPKSLISVTQRVIGPSVEREVLIRPFLTELMNAMVVRDPPPALAAAFWALCNANRASSAWTDVNSYPGIQYIIALVPQATRRPLSNLGDVFVLFSHIFWVFRHIAAYIGWDSEVSAKILTVLALNSEFGGILKVFVVLERLVLQKEYFTALLGGKLVQEWNAFCQLMWKVVAQDEQLAKKMVRFASAGLA